MASSELRKRANWQTISGFKALGAEELFRKSLQEALDSVYPNQFRVDKSPGDFKNIYSSYILPDDTLNKIYNVPMLRPDGRLAYSWGIKMDFAIRNLRNKKVLYGEIKRQDGWNETNTPAAGRGNAHERSCKYFTPGLLKVIRDASGISEEILPFWVVFLGDITQDPRRNREIAYWYQGYEKNYYMWRNTEDIDNISIGDLLDFFENNLLPYLL